MGTSGYQYDHWRDVLYPSGLPKKLWFERYATEFGTVEINNTFYNLPARTTFEDWRRRAPRGFRYALKFSRYGSHMKKLKDPEQPLETFVERARRLKSHLGPILVQLPPGWHVNCERLQRFLSHVPRELRWALEVRDSSWLCDDVFALLERYRVALSIHDLIENHPWRLTADWTYLRYHGPGGAQDKYARGYSPQALSGHAQKIANLIRDGIDVFAYFNNDVRGHAVSNARDLRRFVERRMKTNE